MPGVDSEKWIGEQPDLNKLELIHVKKHLNCVFFGLFLLICAGALLAWWLEYMKATYVLIVLGMGAVGLLKWKYHLIQSSITEDQNIQAEMNKTEKNND